MFFKVYKIKLILFLFTLFSVSLYSISQPVANFDVSIKKGCSPLEVTFINNSTPSTDLTYQWILGNGNTSTLFEPYAIYTNSGSYTITLIVSDGTNSDTLIKSDFITVFQNPVVDFEVIGQHTGCVPLAITLNNLTMEGDTLINNWSWDFGDGHVSNDYLPSQVYLFPGAYNLSLMAIDKNGCSGNMILQNYIEAYKTVASFSADKNESCSGELVTSFSNLSQGSGNLSYIWNFGDGNTSTETSPVHNYSIPGIFNVSLIASDNHGCNDTISKNNFISIIDVSSSFIMINDTACKNDVIHFTNTSTNAYFYSWSFGDSTFSSLQNPVHSYSNSGDYLIKLIVTKNAMCSDTSSALLHIENVNADFSVSQNYTCSLPLYNQYTDHSQNAVSWQWHFGNGDFSTVQNPVDSIIFLPNNVSYYSFIDTLIVTSAFGCKSMKIYNPSVIVSIPRARFTPNNFSSELNGCVPITFEFHNQSIYISSSDSIISWKWTFSDAPMSLNWDVSKTYVQTGSYKVTLSITTALGCSTSFSDSVHTGNQQIPYFILNAPDTICASDSVIIINQSQDINLIDEYYWLFSDGTSLTAPNPVVYFNDTGYISGTLIAVYHGCESVITRDSLIFVKGPFVSFNASCSCNNPLQYFFNGNILGAESYNWSFSDLSPSISDIPQVIHHFNSSGDYHVTLYAENNTTGCVYEVSEYYYVREIEAKFSLSDTKACAGTEIFFDGSLSHDVDEFLFNNFWISYLWHFSDNGEYKYPDNLVSHKFDTKGNYFVSLIVADQNGCRDTLTKTVNIYKPDINFNSDYQNGCIPVNFAFSDQTVSDTTISSWVWSFGDNEFSNEQNPIHTYQEYGLYNVSLFVSDTLGCNSVITKPGFINVQSPDPSFQLSDNTLCVGSSTNFSDISQSVITSYLWNFGDGDTSSSIAPNHAYADTGYYTVSLHILDSHGCDSTLVKENYIHVQQPPLANFVADVFNTNCYPAHISFTDSSVSNYLAGWQWFFGDNNVASEMQNPIHTYWRPGTYNISLIASTTYGCSDTITKNAFITIGGPWAEILHPDTVCIFSPVSLVATNKINVYSLKWDMGNGNYSTSDTAILNYSTYGNVYPSVMLYLDSLHTCDVGITDTVNVYRVIADFTVNNNVYNGCVPLDISCSDQSENARHYLWFTDNIPTSSSAQLIQTLQIPGEHTVKLIISNDFVCSDTIVKNVTVYSLPLVSITSDTIMCRDAGMQLNASGGIDYTWSPQTGLNNALISNPVANPDSSMTYFIAVQDANGCIKDTSVFIEVYQRPVVSLKDTAVVIGEHIQLNALNSEIMQYQWTPSTGLSCSDCPDPVASPLESTVYTVAATDTNNCFTIDFQIFIDILKKYSVDVPDMFTPNGDGLNDVIFVRGWGIKDLLEFRIFNRFGEQVFVSNNLDQGWDGTYKGEQQNTETFTYVVRVRSYNDEIISTKGFIKLIR